MSLGIAEGIQLAQLAAQVLPDLIGTIAGLISNGHSPADALKIVRRDIKSRRAEYERMKAEDHAALRAKHHVDGDDG